MLTELKEEGRILERISRGDELSFRQLVNHYTAHLASFIFKFTGSKEKTEEIIQDVFLQIWMTRETLTAVTHFKAYLFTVSRNYALNAIRSSLREEKQYKRWLQEYDHTYREPDVEEDAVRQSVIEEAINHLPPQQQRVWLLSRREGKRYLEIAEEIHISRETVKKYIQYANASILSFIKQRLDLFAVLTFSLNFFFENFLTHSPLFIFSVSY